MYLRGNSIGTDDDDDDDDDDGRRTKDDGHTLNLSIYLIAGQYVPVLSGCSCRGVWLAPIKRMGITGRNKIESGGPKNGYAKRGFGSRQSRGWE